MPQPRLLVVEDDEAIRLQLKYALRDDFTLLFAEDRIQALAAARASTPELVLLDLGLPPTPGTAAEGCRALEELLTLAPRPKVIVLTGNTERQHAVRCIEAGAFDYHLKPVDIDTLRVMLRRAVFLHGVEQESARAARDHERTVRFGDILGATLPIRTIFTVIERVARTDATVCILGESGTGKELIARAIHQRSRRRHAPFVPINCGAIPEALLEAELFGHEKGAFTGAHVQRRGKLELADQGTLFLDEVGELPPPLQVKLLRFLQDRTIERIGGRESFRLDLRVIAATNQDLKSLLQRGLFRQDLYYRLSVVTIEVPPLRERRDDIMMLANAFLRQGTESGRRRSRFSADAVRAMVSYEWPGNIRELENKVSRALIMARGAVIEPADLDLVPVTAEATLSLRDARCAAEQRALVDVLSRHRGNISRAARELKVSRPTLHDLLVRYAIDAKSYR